MSNTHWYARYPGDYGKDTMGLSMIEHGAYTLLLDYYYSENKGISANALFLHRVCRAFAEEEKIAVEKIVKIYFKEIDGFLYNARADKELEKKNIISKKRSNSAKIKNKKYSANAPANALQMQPQPQPQPQLQRKKEVTVKNSYSVDFEKFWSAYPKNNGAKKPAFEKYQSAIKNGVSHETIIRGAEAYGAFANSEGTEQRYIKHAATWLNQRGWESDYTIQPKLFNGAGRQQPKGKGELAREAANRALEELGVKSRI